MTEDHYAEPDRGMSGGTEREDQLVWEKQNTALTCLLDRLAPQPAIDLGTMTRDEIYDRSYDPGG